jgi:hypothetical protein
MIFFIILKYKPKQLKYNNHNMSSNKVLSEQQLQEFHYIVRTWQRFYYMITGALFMLFEFEDSDSIYSYSFDITKLSIEYTIDDIKEKFNQYGVLIMRPYKNQKKLIVGCGKKPLRNCGGYPFADKQEEKEYHSEHSHDDEYTIDPLHASNPDVIGAIQFNKLDFLAEESFDIIEFEGIVVNVTHVLIYNLIRLLKQNGIVTLNNMPKLMRVGNKIMYYGSYVELTIGKKLFDCNKKEICTNYRDKFLFYKEILSNLSEVSNYITINAMNRINNLHSAELEFKEYELSHTYNNMRINSDDLCFFEDNLKFPIERKIKRVKCEKKTYEEDINNSDEINPSYSYLV